MAGVTNLQRLIHKRYGYIRSFADATNFNYVAIRKICSGSRIPTLAEALHIAEALGITDVSAMRELFEVDAWKN